MGGTSTDVTRFDGELRYRMNTKVGQIRLLSPSVAVETVAAGGGSICAFDGQQLRVGPESAGAEPGPASYGGGGPLTLTDVNLLLGRLDPRRFPFPISEEAARQQLRSVGERVARVSGQGSPESHEQRVLAGFLRIANEKMAAAVRRTSVRLGYDPGDHWLVAFGGAGAQHACALADLLGIGHVVVPVDAALLSALGLAAARIERLAERQVLEPLDEVADKVPRLLAELIDQAGVSLRREGIDRSELSVRQQRAFLRFKGQDSTLEVDASPGADLESAFAEMYQRRFGYQPAGRRLELESLRIVACGPTAKVPVNGSEPAANGSAVETASRRIFSAGRWVHSAVIERQELAVARTVVGPALIVEDHSATVVEEGWLARRDEIGDIHLMSLDSKEAAG
jgi:5-oxoprolinase (ATP-hydrolysing)